MASAAASRSPSLVTAGPSTWPRFWRWRSRTRRSRGCSTDSNTLWRSLAWSSQVARFRPRRRTQVRRHARFLIPEQEFLEANATLDVGTSPGTRKPVRPSRTFARSGAGDVGKPSPRPGLRRLAAFLEDLLVVGLVHARVHLALGQEKWRSALANRLFGDDAHADLVVVRHVIHHIEERLFDYRSKGPGPRLTRDGDFRRGTQGTRREDQIHLVEGE